MNSIEVKKEIANSATHGLGLLLCFVGVPILLALAVHSNQIITMPLYEMILITKCGPPAQTSELMRALADKIWKQGGVVR